MFASAVFSIGTAIVAQYSIALFAVGRFLFLLFVHGSTIVTFVYGAEIIHPKWRTTLGIATMCGFQLGYIFHRDGLKFLELNFVLAMDDRTEPNNSIGPNWYGGWRFRSELYLVRSVVRS